MTVTTEQQAVTVAQEDISIGEAVYRDFLMGNLDHEHGEYEGERCAIEAAARVRLASVSSASAEPFLVQLRRVNSDRYEAWITNPIMLCEHCGADASARSPVCKPPFDNQPHSFTRPHPYLTTRNDAGIMFDALELGGEVGELLNIVKKLEREERGWRGSRANPADFDDECADVLICLDKLARRRNVDLTAATIAKFNATSDKVGLPHRLAASPEPVPATNQAGGVDCNACDGRRVVIDVDLNGYNETAPCPKCRDGSWAHKAMQGWFAKYQSRSAVYDGLRSAAQAVLDDIDDCRSANRSVASLRAALATQPATSRSQENYDAAMRYTDGERETLATQPAMSQEDIDWSASVEAVHEDGRVLEARPMLPHPDFGKFYRGVHIPGAGNPVWFDDKGLSERGGWTIRNATPTPPTATSQEGEGGALTRRVADVMNEDGGCWTACSGCQESDEGYVSEKYYPYSPIFRCQPGGGCSECGGIGVLWQDGAFLASYGDALSEDATPTPPTLSEDTLDWSRPVEAIHTSGQVEPVRVVQQGRGEPHAFALIEFCKQYWGCTAGGEVTAFGWRIRNVALAQVKAS